MLRTPPARLCLGSTSTGEARVICFVTSGHLPGRWILPSNPAGCVGTPTYIVRGQTAGALGRCDAAVLDCIDTDELIDLRDRALIALTAVPRQQVLFMPLSQHLLRILLLTALKAVPETAPATPARRRPTTGTNPRPDLPRPSSRFEHPSRPSVKHCRRIELNKEGDSIGQRHAPGGVSSVSSPGRYMTALTAILGTTISSLSIFLAGIAGSETFAPQPRSRTLHAAPALLHRFQIRIKCPSHRYNLRVAVSPSAQYLRRGD